MSNVSIFKFENKAEIRLVEIDGSPWFVAKDVCGVLGLTNTSQSIRPLASDEKGVNRIDTPGGAQDLSCISESGLYKLIMRSDKPVARRFQDWVTRDVLPAIRKDGAYIMGEEKVATGEMDEDAFVLKAIEILQRKIDRLSQENKAMAPKAVIFDNCVALRQESLTTFVRTLRGVNTMATKRDLADLGYLYRTAGTNQYRVYAEYRDTLFVEKLKAHPVQPYYQIIPTAEGKKLIVQLYQEGKLTMKKSFAV
ncbi:BRO-N domain-containing protein [Metapseudomonas otitidis]|uniref:BRO-N domain-containing protein n=1 Tax=Metapseudomonas otitidis TaxID=319939 RepID=UPI001F1A1306|nr:Bro-N domain-containing protein [Pseudomonas otitidis]